MRSRSCKPPPRIGPFACTHVYPDLGSDYEFARRDELQRFAEEISAPMFRSLPGCLGFVYGVAGSTWVSQTFWDTEEHIEDAEASALYRDVVSRLLDTGVLGGSGRRGVRGHGVRTALAVTR